MRKILFRGKIIGITDWIYGYYAKSGENHFILLDTDSEDNYSIVSPETVGQYTGLTDKEIEFFVRHNEKVRKETAREILGDKE